jgi:hypothetical protein
MNKTIRYYSADVKYGGAPKHLLDMFSVAAEYVIVVPLEFLEMVISILRDRKYSYKTKTRTNDVVIAVQFARM